MYFRAWHHSWLLQLHLQCGTKTSFMQTVFRMPLANLSMFSNIVLRTCILTIFFSTVLWIRLATLLKSKINVVKYFLTANILVLFIYVLSNCLPAFDLARFSIDYYFKSILVPYASLVGVHFTVWKTTLSDRNVTLHVIHIKKI